MKRAAHIVLHVVTIFVATVAWAVAEVTWPW